MNEAARLGIAWRSLPAAIHIFGLGRVGTAILLGLAATRFKLFSVNDPQVVSADNLDALLHATRSDIGKPKVHVVERFLSAQRPDIELTGIHAETESNIADRYIRRAAAVVIASNTPSSRVSADQKALASGKPSISVGVADARKHHAASICVRLPGVDWHACQACYLDPSAEVPRGEQLHYPVVATAGAIATHMITRIVEGESTRQLRDFNLYLINAADYSIEAMSVERRADCSVCGTRG